MLASHGVPRSRAELFCQGINVALGPMMNMGRAAAAGRNWEGFGADVRALSRTPLLRAG